MYSFLYEEFIPSSTFTTMIPVYKITGLVLSGKFCFDLMVKATE